MFTVECLLLVNLTFMYHVRFLHTYGAWNGKNPVHIFNLLLRELMWRKWYRLYTWFLIDLFASKCMQIFVAMQTSASPSVYHLHPFVCLTVPFLTEITCIDDALYEKLFTWTLLPDIKQVRVSWSLSSDTCQQLDFIQLWLFDVQAASGCNFTRSWIICWQVTYMSKLRRA